METPNTVSGGHNATPANRKTLLLTAAVFILPVAIAFTLLKTGWYSSAGTSNRGMLIDPPIVFDELTLRDANQQILAVEQFRKKWWIMYVMPAECDAACKNSLYLMRQTHQALGPEQSRVAELIVIPHDISAEQAHWLQQEFPAAIRTTTDADALDQTLQKAMTDGTRASTSGHLFLVDTMGAIFMHYPAYADEQESILKGRDLLKDLQRVLKISKIG